jgi:hypothetical protein
MKYRRMSRRLSPDETHFRRHCEFIFEYDLRCSYNNLFEWIVSRVNVSMKPRAASEFVIGVLDI